jgi:hypothetical protein
MGESYLVGILLIFLLYFSVFVRDETILKDYCGNKVMENCDKDIRNLKHEIGDMKHETRKGK